MCEFSSKSSQRYEFYLKPQPAAAGISSFLLPAALFQGSAKRIRAKPPVSVKMKAAEFGSLTVFLYLCSNTEPK